MSENELRSGHLVFLIEAIIGSTFWGFSGTVSSILFSVYRMPYFSLLTLRMVISGSLLVIFSKGFIKKADIPVFLLFSIVGLFGVQLFYLGTISYSNAPVATMLQFLFFPIVAFIEYARYRHGSRFFITMAVILALAGTFELATGFPYMSVSMKISGIALLFGIITAFTASVYTLLSPGLVRKYGGFKTVAYGLFMGGLISIPLGAVPSYHYFISIGASEAVDVLMLILFVALVGTLLAFLLYIRSMQVISATEAAVASTMEPISAAISSYILLGIVMSPLQYLGSFLIIIAMITIEFSGKIMKKKSGS